MAFTCTITGEKGGDARGLDLVLSQAARTSGLLLPIAGVARAQGADNLREQAVLWARYADMREMSCLATVSAGIPTSVSRDHSVAGQDQESMARRPRAPEIPLSRARTVRRKSSDSLQRMQSGKIQPSDSALETLPPMAVLPGLPDRVGKAVLSANIPRMVRIGPGSETPR